MSKQRIDEHRFLNKGKLAFMMVIDLSLVPTKSRLEADIVATGYRRAQRAWLEAGNPLTPAILQR